MTHSLAVPLQVVAFRELEASRMDMYRLPRVDSGFTLKLLQVSPVILKDTHWEAALDILIFSKCRQLKAISILKSA